jgi:uncharacterized protein (TIGR02611 family)
MPTEERPQDARGRRAEPAEGERPAEPGDGSGRRSHDHWWTRAHNRLHANPALSLTTKLAITTIGSLVIVAGLVMMVTPGPGIVGIVLGLAILSTEYEWADRWLVRARQKAHEARLRAEAMDPRERRRRLLLTGLVFLAVSAAILGYVLVYDWPRFAVDGWDWVQGLAGWVPDLPGM